VTITEFLAARIGEAQERAGEMGHAGAESEAYACPATRTEPLGDLPYGESACDCGLAERKTRALRVVAAHREIVAECTLLAMVGLAFEGEAGPESAQRIMKHLAAIDSGHPDYDRAWAMP
jgi:hypothetical protein